MDYIKNIEKKDIYYSLCSGFNYYIKASDGGCKVFGKPKELVRHIKTGEMFYLTELPAYYCKHFDLEFWTQLIRNPVDLKHFLWPVDIICTGEGKYDLVFPERALPPYESVKSLLHNDLKLGVELPTVQKFARNFLIAVNNYSNINYTYHEFTYDNMFYCKDTMDVIFDFSFSTIRVSDLYETHYVNPNRIIPDYTDTFYYSNDKSHNLSMSSDFYSVAVILFKLLIGILPYQGSIMAAVPNMTEQEHENWITVYHNNPFFVFDEDDDTNHIGGETGFAKDEKYVVRWNSLPDAAKKMFGNVFRTSNVLRTAEKLYFFSPAQWKEALSL